jgi:hypothetical protein
MSWELTRFVLSLRNLTPTEKAVAHSLAYHTPKHGTAYPSMKTIALEAGLGNRTAAQKVVRRLEEKEVIAPTTSKKGGRNNPTHYQFNLGNRIPTDALSASGKSIPGDSNLYERASLETEKGIPGDARDSSTDKEAVADSSESASAAVSQEQMEKEFQLVWNYYLEAFDKQEILSPTAREKGMAVLSELHRLGHSCDVCVTTMQCAIDVAHHLVTTQQKKKAFFSNWFAIFGKWNTFVSLRQQWTENIPASATIELSPLG